MIELARSRDVDLPISRYVDVPEWGLSKATRVFIAFLGTAALGGAVFMWVGFGKHFFTFDSDAAKGSVEIIAAMAGTFVAVLLFGKSCKLAAKKVGFDRTISAEDLEKIKKTSDIRVVWRLLYAEDYRRNTDLTEHVREGRLTIQQKESLCGWINYYNYLLSEYQKSVQGMVCGQSVSDALIQGDLIELIDKERRDWPTNRDRIFGRVR